MNIRRVVFTILVVAAAAITLCHMVGMFPVITSAVLSAIVAVLVGVVLFRMYSLGLTRKALVPRRSIQVGIFIISAFCGYGFFRQCMGIDVLLVTDRQNRQVLLRMDNTVLLCQEVAYGTGNRSVEPIGTKNDLWISKRISYPFMWESSDMSIRYLGPGRIRVALGSDVLEYSKSGRLLHNGQSISDDRQRTLRFHIGSRDVYRVCFRRR
jgi:hypothetical protein